MRVAPLETSLTSPPADISSSFFFDEAVAVELRDREILRGYKVLLGVEVGFDLQLSSLVDGSVIDYLFGRKPQGVEGDVRRDRVKLVKRYIRELRELQQEQVVVFYRGLLDAIVSLDGSLSHPLYLGFGRMCCFGRNVEAFRAETRAIYAPLYKSLYQVI